MPSAVSRTFRIVCWVTIAVHSVFFAVCLIVTLAQCRPLAKMWDLVGAVEGSCINSTAFFYCKPTIPFFCDASSIQS
jgi:hypothetical protein